MITESLPPENSRTGRSNSAPTSRMISIDSASSESRWEIWYGVGCVTVMMGCADP